MTARKKPEDKLKVGAPAKEAVEPAVAKAICDNLEIGMPINGAAEAEGVHRNTVHTWMERFPKFAQQVTRAKATGMKNLAVKSLAGGKGSSMAAWHLERRYREDYGIRQLIDHSITNGNLDDNDYVRKLAAWRAGVLADDLPGGPIGLVDRGADSPETDPS
jgi:hypothetical protein